MVQQLLLQQVYTHFGEGKQEKNLKSILRIIILIGSKMNREKVMNLLKEYFDNGGYFKDLSRRISFETEKSKNPKNFQD